MNERVTYGHNHSSLGYDYARFDGRSKVRQTVMEDEARAVHRPKPETRAEGIRINPAQVIVFFAFMAVVLLIVFSFAALSEMSRSNEALAKRLTAGQREQQVLSAALESRIKLDEIADVAVNKLGMVKPDRRQIVYIDLSGPEKVEYFNATPWYEDISGRLNDMLAYFG